MESNGREDGDSVSMATKSGVTNRKTISPGVSFVGNRTVQNEDFADIDDIYDSAFIDHQIHEYVAGVISSAVERIRETEQQTQGKQVMVSICEAVKDMQPEKDTHKGVIENENEISLSDDAKLEAVAMTIVRNVIRKVTTQLSREESIDDEDYEKQDEKFVDKIADGIVEESSKKAVQMFETEVAKSKGKEEQSVIMETIARNIVGKVIERVKLVMSTENSDSETEDSKMKYLAAGIVRKVLEKESYGEEKEMNMGHLAQYRCESIEEGAEIVQGAIDGVTDVYKKSIEKSHPMKSSLRKSSMIRQDVVLDHEDQEVKVAIFSQTSSSFDSKIVNRDNYDETPAVDERSIHFDVKGEGEHDEVKINIEGQRSINTNHDGHDTEVKFNMEGQKSDSFSSEDYNSDTEMQSFATEYVKHVINKAANIVKFECRDSSVEEKDTDRKPTSIDCKQECDDITELQVVHADEVEEAGVQALREVTNSTGKGVSFENIDINIAIENSESEGEGSIDGLGQAPNENSENEGGESVNGLGQAPNENSENDGGGSVNGLSQAPNENSENEGGGSVNGLGQAASGHSESESRVSVDGLDLTTSVDSESSNGDSTSSNIETDSDEAEGSYDLTQNQKCETVIIEEDTEVDYSLINKRGGRNGTKEDEAHITEKTDSANGNLRDKGDMKVVGNKDDMDIGNDESTDEGDRKETFAEEDVSDSLEEEDDISDCETDDEEPNNKFTSVRHRFNSVEYTDEYMSLLLKQHGIVKDTTESDIAEVEEQEGTQEQQDDQSEIDDSENDIHYDSDHVGGTVREVKMGSEEHIDLATHEMVGKDGSQEVTGGEDIVEEHNASDTDKLEEHNTLDCDTERDISEGRVDEKDADTIDNGTNRSDADTIDDGTNRSDAEIIQVDEVNEKENDSEEEQHDLGANKTIEKDLNGIEDILDLSDEDSLEEEGTKSDCDTDDEEMNSKFTSVRHRFNSVEYTDTYLLDLLKERGVLSCETIQEIETEQASKKEDMKSETNRAQEGSEKEDKSEDDQEVSVKVKNVGTDDNDKNGNLEEYGSDENSDEDEELEEDDKEDCETDDEEQNNKFTSVRHRFNSVEYTEEYMSLLLKQHGIVRDTTESDIAEVEEQEGTQEQQDDQSEKEEAIEVIEVESKVRETYDVNQSQVEQIKESQLSENADMSGDEKKNKAGNEEQETDNNTLQKAEEDKEAEEVIDEDEGFRIQAKIRGPRLSDANLTGAVKDMILKGWHTKRRKSRIASIREKFECGGEIDSHSSSGSRPNSVGSRRESASSRPSSAGSRRESSGSMPSSTGSRRESAGSRPSSAGSRRESAGSMPSSAGSRRESASSRSNSTGSRRESAGSRRESASSRPNSAGSRRESAGNRRENAGSSWQDSAWSRGESAGSIPSSAGSRRESTSSRPNSAESRRESAGNRRESAGSRWQDSAGSQSNKARNERKIVDMKITEVFKEKQDIEYQQTQGITEIKEPIYFPMKEPLSMSDENTSKTVVQESDIIGRRKRTDSVKSDLSKNEISISVDKIGTRVEGTEHDTDMKQGKIGRCDANIKKEMEEDEIENMYRMQARTRGTRLSDAMLTLEEKEMMTGWHGKRRKSRIASIRDKFEDPEIHARRRSQELGTYGRRYSQELGTQARRNSQELRAQARRNSQEVRAQAKRNNQELRTQARRKSQEDRMWERPEEIRRNSEDKAGLKRKDSKLYEDLDQTITEQVTEKDEEMDTSRKELNNDAKADGVMHQNIEHTAEQIDESLYKQVDKHQPHDEIKMAKLDETQDADDDDWEKEALAKARETKRMSYAFIQLKKVDNKEEKAKTRFDIRRESDMYAREGKSMDGVTQIQQTKVSLASAAVMDMKENHLIETSNTKLVESSDLTQSGSGDHTQELTHERPTTTNYTNHKPSMIEVDISAHNDDVDKVSEDSEQSDPSLEKTADHFLGPRVSSASMLINSYRDEAGHLKQNSSDLRYVGELEVKEIVSEDEEMTEYAPVRSMSVADISVNYYQGNVMRNKSNLASVTDSEGALSEALIESAEGGLNEKVDVGKGERGKRDSEAIGFEEDCNDTLEMNKGTPGKQSERCQVGQLERQDQTSEVANKTLHGLDLSAAKVTNTCVSVCDDSRVKQQTISDNNSNKKLSKIGHFELPGKTDAEVYTARDHHTSEALIYGNGYDTDTQAKVDQLELPVNQTVVGKKCEKWDEIQGNIEKEIENKSDTLETLKCQPLLTRERQTEQGFKPEIGNERKLGNIQLGLVLDDPEISDYKDMTNVNEGEIAEKATNIDMDTLPIERKSSKIHEKDHEQLDTVIKPMRFAGLNANKNKVDPVNDTDEGSLHGGACKSDPTQDQVEGDYVCDMEGPRQRIIEGGTMLHDQVLMGDSRQPLQLYSGQTSDQISYNRADYPDLTHLEDCRNVQQQSLVSTPAECISCANSGSENEEDLEEKQLVAVGFGHDAKVNENVDEGCCFGRTLVHHGNLESDEGKAFDSVNQKGMDSCLDTQLQDSKDQTDRCLDRPDTQHQDCKDQSFNTVGIGTDDKLIELQQLDTGKAYNGHARYSELSGTTQSFLTSGDYHGEFPMLRSFGSGLGNLQTHYVSEPDLRHPFDSNHSMSFGSYLTPHPHLQPAVYGHRQGGSRYRNMHITSCNTVREHDLRTSASPRSPSGIRYHRTKVNIDFQSRPTYNVTPSSAALLSNYQSVDNYRSRSLSPLTGMSDDFMSSTYGLERSRRLSYSDRWLYSYVADLKHQRSSSDSYRSSARPSLSSAYTSRFDNVDTTLTDSNRHRYRNDQDYSPIERAKFHLNLMTSRTMDNYTSQSPRPSHSSYVGRPHTSSYVHDDPDVKRWNNFLVDAVLNRSSVVLESHSRHKNYLKESEAELLRHRRYMSRSAERYGSASTIKTQSFRTPSSERVRLLHSDPLSYTPLTSVTSHTSLGVSPYSSTYASRESISSGFYPPSSVSSVHIHSSFSDTVNDRATCRKCGEYLNPPQVRAWQRKQDSLSPYRLDDSLVSDDQYSVNEARLATKPSSWALETGELTTVPCHQALSTVTPMCPLYF